MNNKQEAQHAGPVPPQANRFLMIESSMNNDKNMPLARLSHFRKNSTRRNGQ